jgi:micrococcal nuclease
MSLRKTPALAAIALLAARLLGAQPVYVTETGLAYHLPGCPYLQRTRLPVLLPEAAELGYAPCGVCRPPAPPAGAAAGPQEQYRVDLAGVDKCEPGNLAAMPRALVVRTVDGDTVHVVMPRPPEGLRTRERLRLLGVDCPELGQASPAAQQLARASSEFTRRRLEGRVVHLAFDWRLRDGYGRLLAYVYLPDGSCHNAAMIREGYAHAYTRFPFRFLQEFRALQAAARRQGRGLWSDACEGQPSRAQVH